MLSLPTDDEYLKIRSLRFVRRMFLMRQLGTFLCFFPIMSVLLENGAGKTTLVMLALNAFLWPAVAYLLSSRSKDLVKVEQRNLTIDALWGGMWVAIMGISPIPSLIILAIQISDRYSAGGWKQLRPALFAFCLTFIIVWSATGCPIRLNFSSQTVWLTLPLATVYLVALSILSRQLTVRLRDKSREFERVALLDPRLHIPNRRLFEQRLASAWLQSQRGTHAAYLMLLDVDNFKQVNDSYGHEVGDFLLAEVSEALRDVISVKDVPARFGGDELAVIIYHSDEHDAFQLAARMLERIEKIRLPCDEVYRCTVSIGIAPAKVATSASEWLRHADHALYETKRAGKNGFRMSDGHISLHSFQQPGAEAE
ncbi:diguanylate cyclase [Erwiniaceae bacterium BAC15a-03b]|uniref:diguanylate cyclase n=2 Tax=Winslowiella arboricola TaxID=2978220 RepID=A0A9J6PL99_9GAMM|nr:diguanylate cyclase [Winslowiella arboricola]MCU5773555.1 diguanylate cyclase [Winslowiella arboricola]MCU5776533.1 diguanylate cyclase [Winslowiella arboricola]